MGSQSTRATQPHLLFQVVARTPKTVVVGVIERRSGDALGEIKWYGAWRQYAFLPLAERTVWSRSCLAEVSAEIDRLMAARRARLADVRISTAEARLLLGRLEDAKATIAAARQRISEL